MTKFDQIKILDNQIKANKAQYMLHRKNTEISVKSSGELDKYEYLAGEDLDYKPDALTQAKFEYSPLGKTLTFGSTKEDKKQGLLKRLANINKANNLHNLEDINTSIYPRDIDYYRLNKDKFDMRRFYEGYNKLESLEEKLFMMSFIKKIEHFKNDDILSDDINKKTRILNNTSKVYNNLLDRYKDKYFEQYKQYNEEWEKKYDYKNFNDLTDDKIFNIDLAWMYNPQLYDEISQDVFARYNKVKHSNELESIQTFLDNITKEYIKNKKDALEEFKTVKNNVKSDIVKELECAIFGYDYDDDNEEPKYEESIAERTKMSRQNKESDKKDVSRTFAPPDPDSDDSDKLTEMYYTPYSLIIDDENTEKETEQTEKVYEGGYDKKGYDGAGYDKVWEFNKYGFNKDGYDKWGFNKYGFNKDGKKDKQYNKWGYNINGFDRQGFNEDHYNINGYNHYGFDRQGYKRKAVKKNIPGSGLQILTPQQMLARLPILLAQIKAGNKSREFKNKIRQLLYSLYRSRKIRKTVYKNLIATI